VKSNPEPAPSPGAGPSSAESQALRQIRESAQAMLAEGKVDEAFELFLSALDAVLRKTRELELLVQKLRKERVGKSSERIDPGQLQLLFEQLLGQGGGEPEPKVDPEAEAREDAELDKEIERSGIEKNLRPDASEANESRLSGWSVWNTFGKCRRTSERALGAVKLRSGSAKTRSARSNMFPGTSWSTYTS